MSKTTVETEEVEVEVYVRAYQILRGKVKVTVPVGSTEAVVQAAVDEDFDEDAWGAFAQWHHMSADQILDSGADIDEVVILD